MQTLQYSEAEKAIFENVILSFFDFKSLVGSSKMKRFSKKMTSPKVFIFTWFT